MHLVYAKNCPSMKDSRIPTRRLNKCIPWLDSPFLLRLLDHTQSNPILYATTRIEQLNLCVYLGFDSQALRDSVQSNERCVTDQLGG